MQGDQQVVTLRLRTENLTVREVKELTELLRDTPDVQQTQYSPPIGVPMNRSVQASLGVMDVVVVVGGYAASKLLSKPLEDIGKGFSEEMNLSEWGKTVARFLKSVHKRPDDLKPTIIVHSVKEPPSTQH